MISTLANPTIDFVSSAAVPETVINPDAVKVPVNDVF